MTEFPRGLSPSKSFVFTQTLYSQGYDRISKGTVPIEVRLTDGCELALDWPSRTGSGRYELNFTLVGSGTLTIRDASGRTLVTYDTVGEKYYEILDPDPNTALSFAYAGTGSATLGQFRNDIGMAIIVR